MPCKKWVWISNTLPPLIAGKTLSTLFLNSSKSKSRQKFMKLGMLSWSGINMPWYKFCPIWGRFGYMLLKTSMMVFGRERPTFGGETISIASYCFQFFSSVNIEQQECCVQFWNFSRFVWTFLYINWVFQAFYVHNSNLKYMHILQCIQTGWKIKYVSLVACLGSMQELGMNVKHPATVTRPQTLRYLVFKF